MSIPQRIRAELGQLSWVVRRYASLTRLRKQARAIRNLSLPDLPRKRRTPGSVWAVSVVRDERDVLPSVLAHLLEQGVDHVLVADNRSTDGTRELLAELAREDRRIHVALDEEPAHIQSEKVTTLARFAWSRGADWIIPFDADEFWFADGVSVVDYLRAHAADVGIVHADFHHMVPITPAPYPLRDSRFVLDATPSNPGKVAARAHPLLEIWPGNHNASRVGHVISGLHIAHAQYRSPTQIARKVRQGVVSSKLTGEDLSWFSPHWIAGSRLTDAEIHEVFARISRGLPDERIEYKAVGPMLDLTPLRWETWDPAHEIRDARLEAAGDQEQDR